MGSRKELLKTIELQEDKLRKYETRFRDVVQAYKGLVKEKDALESSLKAVTVTNKVQGKDKPVSADEENESACESKETTERDKDESANDTVQLREHIQTLTKALSTLSDEKSRIESSFQADKKKLLKEKDEIEKRIEEEQKDRETVESDVKSESKELRNKLRLQQQDREKEQNDHALMLRELQKLVSSERMAKEYLEQKLEDTQEKLRKKETAPDKTAEYERRVQQLSDELSIVQERLQLSEDMANKPSPIMIELQKQMADLEAQHRISLYQEQERANEAEKRLSKMADSNEERVAILEEKLSELSELVGNYDRIKMQDQASILKLKERVAQLDIENTALARAASKDTCPTNDSASTDVDDDSNLSVQGLIDKIAKLKGLLKLANQRSEVPINLDEIFNSDLCHVIRAKNQQNNELDHSNCHLELQKVKDEFEKYKLRAQSVLKNKNTKDNDTIKEISTLSNQLSEVKDKLSIVKSQLRDEEVAHVKSVTDLQSTVKEMKVSHKKKLSESEEAYKADICDLEKQMQRQRDHTLNLLEEKENELDKLRSTSNRTISNKRKVKRNLSSSSDKQYSSFVGETSERDLNDGEGNEVISMLSSSKKASKSEAQMLHYEQELARLQGEVKSLHKSKHELESTLREMQNVSITKEEKYCDNIDALKSMLHRAELSNNEHSNMEYLKNVIVRYIKSTDSCDKLHMLNAIAAVLHFTSKELVDVKQHVQFYSS